MKATFLTAPRRAAPAAEVILLRDDLRAVPWLVRLSWAARRCVRQNLAWAFVYNLAGLALAVTGHLQPVAAAAAPRPVGGPLLTRNYNAKAGTPIHARSRENCRRYRWRGPVMVSARAAQAPEATRMLPTRRALRLVSLLLVPLLLAACAAAPGGPPGAGDRLPLAQARALSGEEVALSGGPGQAVWLSFWASWCGPCRDEWPGIDAAARDLGPGVRIVAVAVGEAPETVAAFVAEHPAALPDLAPTSQCSAPPLRAGEGQGGEVCDGPPAVTAL